MLPRYVVAECNNAAKVWIFVPVRRKTGASVAVLDVEAPLPAQLFSETIVIDVPPIVIIMGLGQVAIVQRAKLRAEVEVPVSTTCDGV
jgi:hypothetical protein